jgi:hypothetical protein
LFVATPLSGLPAWTAGERLAGALHLGVFDQPEKNKFLNRLLIVDMSGFLSSIKN